MKIIKEIYSYREMIFSLVRKDLRGRYKGSALGFLWTFLNPLLQLVVYTIVFSTILKNGIEKYYLFLFVTLVPWIFFSSALTSGAKCVIAQKDMVKKIYFPREVLPLAYVTSCFINMLLCFIVIFAVMAFSHTKVVFSAILFLPIVMLTEYFLALGVAFIASAITVYFRDMEHILSIVSMAWMYMTPIMYKYENIPEQYQNIFRINPMLPVIESYREILYYGKIPNIVNLLQATLIGIVSCVLGMALFGKLKRHFAEEL